MLLRSIPPANRRSPTPIAIGVRQLSSMRAATATGFTMVGGQTKLGSTSAGETFRPKIVRPNLCSQRRREIYQNAFQVLAKQLEVLLATATEPDEIAIWQQKLNRLKDE